MRRVLLLSLLLAPLASAEAATTRSASGIGSSREFGLGAVIGAPTGVTAKFYLGDSGALEASLATWWDRYGWAEGFYGHLVYLWHPAVLAKSSGFTMPLHVGVGGFITDGYHDHWGRWYRDDGWGEGGPRGVVGLDFDLTKVPLQFFVDAGLNVTVLPGLWPSATLGTGARYYF